LASPLCLWSTVAASGKTTISVMVILRLFLFHYFCKLSVVIGSLVTEDCGSCHDVRRRIALGTEAFNKKSELMWGSLSLHLKKRIVKAIVWSVALYGSETWTLQEEDIRRLEAFEIWIWRQMMKVPWTEHKTNEEILKMDETERKIMDTVRSRQKRSHPETWLITENNVRRTNTGEEGLQKTKNNAFGLATEDRRRQYQLRRTKDVRPGQQMESMKMETCHMAEHYS